MEAAFLDANVLFSAAYRSDSGLTQLWRLPDVVLITSECALEEARRNLKPGLPRARLAELASSMKTVPGAVEWPLPEVIELAEKDRPILAAAISAGATHLLTGDLTHVGRYFGEVIEGVLVLPPALFLRERLRR